MAEKHENLKAVLRGNCRLTKNLYKILAKSEGNVFFSPISIHAILSLAFQGAEGTTRAALAKVLNVPDVAVASEGYKDVMARLISVKGFTLLMANKVFLKDSYKLQESFKNVVTTHYYSEVQLLDFAKSTVAADTINTWVEDKTNKKIKDLIQAGDLDDDTRLVLVNAIYFKGRWAEPFDADDTEIDDFYLNDNDTIKVQMMHLKKKFYFKDDENLDAKVLELPYTNNKMSMIFILPNKRNGIAELEEKLARTDLIKITKDMYQPEVIVSLPKFKFEQTIDLKASLSELGLGEIFDDRANFSGMLDSPEQLYASKVVQKAFIEVNEKGAEAGAATTICLKRVICKREPKEFLANHPFLIILQYRQKFILFKGRIANPIY